MKKISGAPDAKEEIVFNPRALKVTYKIGGDTVEVPVEVPGESERDVEKISDGLEDVPNPSPGDSSGYSQYGNSSDRTQGLRPSVQKGEVSGFSHFENRMESDQKAMEKLVKQSEEIDFDPLPDNELEVVREVTRETIREVRNPSNVKPEDQSMQNAVGKFIAAEKGNLFEKWFETTELVEHVAELITMDNKGFAKEALKEFIANRYQPDEEGY